MQGNRNFAGLLCMVGMSALLGMMGKQLVACCTTGTCDHVRAVKGNWKACHSLNTEVLGTDCTSCPCASSACSVTSGETQPSTKRCRWNLAAKLQVWCLRGCAGWKGAYIRYTVGFVVRSLAREVPLVPERESGSKCLYRNDPCQLE